MNKGFATLLLCAGITAWPLSSQAENLLEVFQQALKHDPTFQTAQAQWLATQELIPITRGVLLPNANATGSIGDSSTRVTFDGGLLPTQTFDGTSQEYQINISQALFNYKGWAQLQNAKAQAKQAFANYNAASQDLMIRVATAYFGVLQAYELLQATEATKRSLAEQLKQTEEQFKVGLIAITGVEQVKASYDIALANEIANQNTVADKLEELRAITGVFYSHLSGANMLLPLVMPQPSDINAWVEIAQKQSYAYTAARFATEAAKDNVKVQRAQHYPVVSAFGSYDYQSQSGGSTSDDSVSFGTSPGSVTTTMIGVQASMPISTGGTILAQTRQAAYQYAEAAAQMQQTYLNTLQQTRESYLGVISGIGKLKADRQSLISNQSSLNSTKSAYTVGTATIVDVLQQQSNLYSAMTNYATDQYDYLTSTLTLKEAAGTLCVRDLAIINSWLGKDINLAQFNFNAHQLDYGSPQMETHSTIQIPTYTPTELAKSIREDRALAPNPPNSSPKSSSKSHRSKKPSQSQT